MSTGRTNTPSWVPHLMGALLTAATVWATIRTEVPAMVQDAVHVEVDAMTARMVAQQDSAWKDAQVQLHMRIEHEARSVRDSLQATLYLVQRGSKGTVTYSPNITVAADTSGQSDLVNRLDQILDQNEQLMQRINATLVKPERTRSKKGSDGWHR